MSTVKTAQLEVQRLGFGDAAVDYVPTWELQREIHAGVVAGQRGDTVLLLEHQSV